MFQKKGAWYPGPPHCTFKGSHFIQEGAPQEIVQSIDTLVHAQAA